MEGDKIAGKFTAHLRNFLGLGPIAFWGYRRSVVLFPPGNFQRAAVFLSCGAARSQSGFCLAAGGHGELASPPRAYPSACLPACPSACSHAYCQAVSGGQLDS